MKPNTRTDDASMRGTRNSVSMGKSTVYVEHASYALGAPRLGVQIEASVGEHAGRQTLQSALGRKECTSYSSIRIHTVDTVGGTGTHTLCCGVVCLVQT